MFVSLQGIYIVCENEWLGSYIDQLRKLDTEEKRVEYCDFLRTFLRCTFIYVIFLWRINLQRKLISLQSSCINRISR